MVVTDASSTITELSDYYPYGSIRTDSKSSGQEQRKYIGEQYDTATNLSYLNARYYDGNRGQFTSEDPEFWSGKQNLENPQSLNSYSYSYDNPINVSDPSGRVGVQTGPGAIVGILQGIVNILQGLLSIAQSPAQSTFGLATGVTNMVSNTVNHPINTAISLGKSAIQLGNTFKNSSDFNQGKMLGGGAVMIGSMFVPGGAEEGVAGALEDSALVCRGGLCGAGDFIKGASKIDSSGNLYGISVESGNGNTLGQLGKSLQRYPNIGVTTAGQIRQAGGEIIQTGLRSSHYEINGLNGSQLQNLFTPTIFNNFK